MNTLIFSQAVVAHLHQAGWTIERRIEIKHYVQALEAVGYTVFPVVYTFLTSFGGLDIGYTLEFNPTDFADNIHPDNVTAYQTIINSRICVIGVWQQMTLVMDQRGQVFAGFGRELWFCGISGIDAIERLLTHADIRKLN